MKKEKEKEKSKLKKAPPISSKKPSKRLKKVNEDEEDVEAVEPEIEEELDEDDEDEDIVDDEEELELGDDDEEGPAAKKGKAGKAAPGKKGRPGKRQVIDVDDLEPDLEILEDETELEEIVIPKARKKKNGAVLDLEGEGMIVEDAKPLTRLGLIRARHEAIRREIDQIREDLESDEEE